MTCKDCIHYEVCNEYYHLEPEDEAEAEKCSTFKDKSRFVELPCKVGTKVYVVIEGDISSFVDEGRVVSFAVEKTMLEIYARYECGLTYWHNANDLGKSVFLTSEEAEEKLKEMENKG